MPTLVLPPRFTGDSQLIWRAAIEAGWDVIRPGWGSDPILAEDPVIYGETLFTRMVAKRLGVEVVDPAPDFLVQVRERMPHAIRREVSWGTLEDAWSLCGPTFVKPAVDKAFTPRVYSNGGDVRRNTTAFDPTMSVLMSQPVKFGAEYRMFVKGGDTLIPQGQRVATASIYIRDGELAESDGSWACDPKELAQAMAFAEHTCYVLGPGWSENTTNVRCDLPSLLPSGFVLDVGVLAEGADKGQFVVVEANPAWGSGLCGCDPSKVLEVLRRTTVRPSHLSP